MAGASRAVQLGLLRPGQRSPTSSTTPPKPPSWPPPARSGARTHNGLGMLIHQAAAAFTLWTGQPAPLDAMRQGALQAIAAR